MEVKNVEKAAKRIQDLFYDEDSLITGKFGGAFIWSRGPTVFGWFVYLGSWKEAVEDLQATGLLDDDIFIVVPKPLSGHGDAILSEDYEVLCTSDQPCPQFENGMVSSAYEFNSYAEVEINYMCTGPLFGGFWLFNSGDFCKDLGIDDDECEDIFQWSLPV